MSSTFISLASLSMDLKRVALGYHRGSYEMAERFFEEALKRRTEINKATVKPYIRKLLENLDKIFHEKDTVKKAEDALMYSVLFQNAALRD